MGSGSSRRGNRWKYRLEKGNPYLLGLVMLVTALTALVATTSSILVLIGEFDSFVDAAWWSFLHLSDTGYLGQAEGVARRITGVVLWLAGLFGVTAFLIAITSHIVTVRLNQLRDHGFDIAFAGHVVIVGWNDKIFTLIEELLKGDPEAEIAILGTKPKDEAELELEKRIFRPLDTLSKRRGGRDARRQVVYRRGSPRIAVDLRRVAVDRARSCILLADPEDRGLTADVSNLQAYLAVKRYRGALTRKGSEGTNVTTLVEVTDDRFRPHIFLAGGLDPRADSWVQNVVARHKILQELPEPETVPMGEQLCLVNVDELVSRVIVQCAVQPRLSAVLEELLSFDGKEFFVRTPTMSGWEGVVEGGRELDEVQLLCYLGSALRDAIVCGVYERYANGAGRAHFDPKQIRAHFHEWPLVLLGPSEGLRGGELTAAHLRRPIVGEVPPVPPSDVERPRRHYRVLLLGHNRRVPVLIEQFAAYTAQYEELDLHLTFVSPELDEAELRQQVQDQCKSDRHLRQEHVVVVQRDYSDWKVMADLLRQPRSETAKSGPPQPTFDTIVLLAEDCALHGNRVDARVILGVVMLRAFRSDPLWKPRLERSGVVAELLDPQNVEVVRTEHWIADVIVSNQYVSRFMAQVSLDPRLEDIHRELFDYGDREIYDRPMRDYVDTTGPLAGTFRQAMASAAQRDEVALGYVMPPSPGATSRQLTIELAPPPGARVPVDGRLLVIA